MRRLGRARGRRRRREARARAVSRVRTRLSRASAWLAWRRVRRGAPGRRSRVARGTGSAVEPRRGAREQLRIESARARERASGRRERVRARSSTSRVRVECERSARVGPLADGHWRCRCICGCRCRCRCRWSWRRVAGGNAANGMARVHEWSPRLASSASAQWAAEAGACECDKIRFAVAPLDQ